MTVCTYELALLHFCPRLPRFTFLNQVAHICELQVSRKVIPGHRCRVENAAAVSTRSRTLKTIVQLDQALAVLLRLSPAPNTVSGEVLAIVVTPAGLAPRLMAAHRRGMELVAGLPHATPSTSLHVVKVDIEADVIPSID